MKPLAARIGMWAAIAQTAFSLIYVVGLGMLMAALFSRQSMAEVTAMRWTDVQTYAAHYADDPFSMWAGLAVQADVFLTGFSVLVIFLVLHELTHPDRQIVTRIASALALALMALSCMAYYIQIASVHQTIVSGGDLAGLAQFAESNASSPMMAVLQLSWTLLYGLTTLVVAPLFSTKGLERWIRGLFVVNGVIGISVGILYACGVNGALPVSILGLIATAFAYPLLAILFHRTALSAAPVLSLSAG
jgi:hypothetical protein